jgi:hypothetical protein
VYFELNGGKLARDANGGSAGSTNTFLSSSTVLIDTKPDHMIH